MEETKQKEIKKLRIYKNHIIWMNIKSDNKGFRYIGLWSKRIQ